MNGYTKCGRYIQWHTNSVLRRESLAHATTWMIPEDTMLCEVSQPQKDKYYIERVSGRPPYNATLTYGLFRN